jgi:hypothetical protein
MSAKYFSTCRTVAEIKKEYKRLAMLHHPDRGGDTATMQAINAEYTAALRRSDGETSIGEDKREHTYTYDAAKEAAIMDFIDRLIKSGVLSDKVEAFLIGTWVWVQGDTRSVKDTLKELGCKWHSKRVCWFWNCDEHRSFYSRKGFDSLAAQYGAAKIKGEDKQPSRQHSLLAA